MTQWLAALAALALAVALVRDGDAGTGRHHAREQHPLVTRALLERLPKPVDTTPPAPVPSGPLWTTPPGLGWPSNAAVARQRGRAEYRRTHPVTA